MLEATDVRNTVANGLDINLLSSFTISVETYVVELF